MYEPKINRPVPMPQFIRRVVAHFTGASALVLTSLIGGMLGYSHFEGLAWRDAFLNSAMLLGGMGPVNSPQTDGGKLFAGVFALYAGLLFVVVAGFVFAPFIHRLLHVLHWDDEGSG